MQTFLYSTNKAYVERISVHCKTMDFLQQKIDYNELPPRIIPTTEEIYKTRKPSESITSAAPGFDYLIIIRLKERINFNYNSFFFAKDDNNLSIFYYIPAIMLSGTSDINAIQTVDKVLSDKSLIAKKFTFVKGSVNASDPTEKLRNFSLALGAKYLYDMLTPKGFVLEELNGKLTLYNKQQMENEIATRKSFISDDEVNELLDKHTDWIKKKYNIKEEILPQEELKYGKGVTLRELYENIQKDVWIKKVQENLIRLLEWKKVKYDDLLVDYTKQVEADKKRLDDAKLTPDERKEFSGSTANIKIITSNILNAKELVIAQISRVESLTIEDVRKSFMKAYNTLKSIQNDEIVETITTMISTLRNGYQAFSTSFRNIVITAPAGSGKTTTAKKVSSVFVNTFVISSDMLRVVSRSDMVASYLGQTATKTKLQLFSTLEGVLFIDEAYQLGGCPNEDAYGMESLTEIVNFLDKYVGLSVVIVAGYENEMKKCFFDRNEGLIRRFPITFKIKSSSQLQLLYIYLSTVIKSLGYDPFIINENIDILYLLIGKLKDEGKIPNLGGDMQIAANSFITQYLLDGDVKKAILDSSYTYCTRYGDKKTCHDIVNKYDK